MSNWSDQRLDDLARDVRGLGEDIRSINQTLSDMAGAEMAELRRRADFPRRLFYAVGAPVLASVITALFLFVLGVLHVH